MMLRRAFLIASAFVVAGASATAFDAPGIGRPGIFLVVLLVATLAALVSALVRVVPGIEHEEPTDDRPADGLVPVVVLPGVEGIANEADPSTRAFQRMTPIAEVSRRRSFATRRPLRGRVGLFSIFVGRDGSSWSDREVAEAFESLARMGRWLEGEAGRWSAPVNLELIGTYFRGDDSEAETVELAVALDPYENVIDEADADIRGIASASRAAAGLGFADLADLIARVDPRADHDLTVWFVHLLRAGRSSAVAPARFQFPGVGLALCYARESSSSEPLVGLPYVDPVTLAHEFLHLFGASDKYGTSIASFPPRSVTSRDVMRLDRTRLSQLRVDPLTATELGWASPASSGAGNRPASSRA